MKKNTKLKFYFWQKMRLVTGMWRYDNNRLSVKLKAKNKSNSDFLGVNIRPLLNNLAYGIIIIYFNMHMT